MIDFLFDIFDGILDLCSNISGEKNEYNAMLAAEDERAKAAKIERAIAEGKWVCECGYINSKHTSECSSCGRYKKLSKSSTAYAGTNATSDTWLCSKCGSINENANFCSLCGNKKE